MEIMGLTRKAKRTWTFGTDPGHRTPYWQSLWPGIRPKLIATQADKDILSAQTTLKKNVYKVRVYGHARGTEENHMLLLRCMPNKASTLFCTQLLLTKCSAQFLMSEAENITTHDLESKEMTPQTVAASMPEGGLDGWLTVLGVLVVSYLLSRCRWRGLSALAMFSTFGAVLSFGVFQDYYTVISLARGDNTCSLRSSVPFWMTTPRRPSVGLAPLSFFWILQWDSLLEDFMMLAITGLWWCWGACFTSFRALL